MAHALDVIEKAQQARGDGRDDAQDEVGRPAGEQQHGEHDAHEHDDAAHGGRALLHKVRLRAVGADLLANAVLAHDADERGHDRGRDEASDEDRDEHEVGGVLRPGKQGAKHVSPSPP